ncbi:MAG: AAA family ATPase [Phycisphaerales bacterium JB041]
MRTIAIVNQKGGCGKTTTAINLGACLGRLGRRTLLVDLDPQGHCAAGLGVPESQIEFDATDLLMGGTPSAAPQAREFWRAASGLNLIPSRVRLAGLEAPASPLAGRPNREHSLADALRPLANDFDVCLIDCPPSIGLLTFNALVAADLVLVPVETAYFSMQGASRQLKTVRSVSRRLETPIRCAVLPTLHEPGLAVAADLLDELKRQFGKRLLPIVVHRDPALREAASFGRPVFEHAPNSQASRDYAALASVLIESESLAASADDEDWSDIDAVGPARRPTPQTVDALPHGTDRPAANAASDLLYRSTEPASGGASTHFSSPYSGEVIVTLDGGHLESLQARRSTDTPNRPVADTPGLSRAEELARRSAATRPAASPLPAASRCDLRGTRPVFGTTLTGSGVEFVQPGALGRRVQVAGSFSGWKPIELIHDAESATHAIRLDLQPGRHEYRLIVDGTWTADPYNTDWILSEFGEPHSLVEVPARNSPQQVSNQCCGAD